MSPLNFKDFLTFGVCLQTGPNTFKLLTGPFKPASLEEIQASSSSTFLYKSNFWDFLFSSGQGPQNFVYSARSSLDLNREEFIGLIEKEFVSRPEIHWEPVEAEDFKAQFDWSQKLFQEGKSKKTVPVIRQTTKMLLKSENVLWMLLSLLKKNNFGWTYAYFENQNGMLGHTPEMLLSWDKSAGCAETVAIAGTVAAAAGAREEILKDPKIRQEHNYVIDDIELKLAGFSAVKEATEVLELKHLLHLQTKFEMKMTDMKTVLKCASILHPTAAMGIYPYNERTLKEFSEFKLQRERGAFAGPIGYLDSHNSLILVPIRNITFDRHGAQIYSGCGITAESRYSSELEELENKRNSVKKMLGLMND